MVMSTDPTGQTYLSITVNNVGSQPTTVTHVTLHTYSSLWRWIRRRADPIAYVVMNQHAQGHQVPYLLKVGEMFFYLTRQDQKIEDLSRAKRLFVQITHSFSDKPLRLRVKPIEAKPAKAAATSSKPPPNAGGSKGWSNS
jgi:hypothetical protein